MVYRRADESQSLIAMLDVFGFHLAHYNWLVNCYCITGCLHVWPLVAAWILHIYMASYSVLAM